MAMKQKDMISMSDPRVAQIGHPAPAWLMSYADLMTEMVCFFVVLYALSAVLNKQVQQSKQDVENSMQKNHISGDVKVDKDGLHVTLEEKGEKAFFQSGSSDLSPELIKILDKLMPQIVGLAKTGHEVLVEGHTDNVPIHTARFSSNWELSTARATSVVQYLIAHEGFPSKNMGAVGYGEFKPLVPNDSDENRSVNRRVVFFVKNATSEKHKTGVGGDVDNDHRESNATAPPSDGSAAPADGSADTSAPAAAPSEPSTDTALPLPQEAPAEQPGQQ